MPQVQVHPLRFALLLEEVPGCAYGNTLSQVPGVTLAAWHQHAPMPALLAGAPCELRTVLAISKVVEEPSLDQAAFT